MPVAWRDPGATRARAALARDDPGSLFRRRLAHLEIDTRPLETALAV